MAIPYAASQHDDDSVHIAVPCFGEPKPMTMDMFNRIQNLVRGVDVDLSAPLTDDSTNL